MKIFRKISSHYKTSSLGSRLLKYFASFAIIPIILFSIPLSIYLVGQSINRIKTETINRVDRFSSELDLLMEDAFEIGNTISRSSIVQDILSHEYKVDTEQYLDETLLNSELAKMLQYTSNSIDVYILGTNGGQFKSKDKSFLKNDLKEEAWFLDAKKAKLTQWLQPHNDSLVVKTLKEGHISLIIPIQTVLEPDVKGVILVEISIPPYLHNVEQLGQSSAFLIDEEQTLVLENTGIMLYKKLSALPELLRNNHKSIRYWSENEDGFNTILLENRKAITAYRHSVQTPWVYCITISKRAAYKNITVITVIAAGIVILLSLFSYFLSYRVSITLTKPIIELSNMMALVRKGDFTARTENPSEDEIGVLSRDFNTMVIDITKLMDRIYEEQHKIKQYELMLLQAQINPHFLYNTLDSIIWLIRMKESEDSIKMIQALTAFLRTGLNKGKDIINLQQELDNVNSYLTIQQLRYKKKLSFEIDFPDELMTQPLPKLILQPLVENAIYHGIKNKNQGGFIHIYGYSQGKDIYIIISDDGIGMTRKKLEELSGSPTEDVELDGTGSYGFKNVRERLKLFFKDKCTINIFSQEEEGTSITIRISGDVGNV